jgi:hypothetical protein
MRSVRDSGRGGAQDGTELPSPYKLAHETHMSCATSFDLCIEAPVHLHGQGERGAEGALVTVIEAIVQIHGRVQTGGGRMGGTARRRRHCTGALRGPNVGLGRARAKRESPPWIACSRRGFGGEGAGFTRDHRLELAGSIADRRAPAGCLSLPPLPPRHASPSVPARPSNPHHTARAMFT